MTFEFSEVHHVNVLRDSVTAERAKARGTGLNIGICLECLRSNISSFPVASCVSRDTATNKLAKAFST